MKVEGLISLCSAAFLYTLDYKSLHLYNIKEGRRLEGGVSACLYVTRVIISKAVIIFCYDRFEILPEQ